MTYVHRSLFYTERMPEFSGAFYGQSDRQKERRIFKKASGSSCGSFERLSVFDPSNGFGIYQAWLWLLYRLFYDIYDLFQRHGSAVVNTASFLSQIQMFFIDKGSGVNNDVRFF